MNKFIFDLDGTIVNTQIPFNSFVESELLRIHQNIIISPEELALNFTGMSTRKVFSEKAPNCDINFMVKRKWEMMYELIETKELRCLPGMYDLLFDLNVNGNQMAIASASSPLWIKSCLDYAIPDEGSIIYKHKLIDFFGDKCFSAENCQNNKPKPDVILMANESFEHSISGITYTIGDSQGDVIAGIAGNFPVLYLSEINKEFDDNPLVKRFNSTLELCSHIRENLM
jgi:beta-phosphoglucomutase-like phosphatase (HAD superfamily)